MSSSRTKRSNGEPRELISLTAWVVPPILVSAGIIYGRYWRLALIIVGGSLVAGIVSAIAARRADLDDSMATGRDTHTIALCALSGFGVFHFSLSTVAWLMFFWRFGDAYVGMTTPHLFEELFTPVFRCLTLLSAFSVCSFFCWRIKRGRELILLGCIAISLVAFLSDVHFSRAQIHVFGPPGGNHFYATWWIYSAGPHWSPATRYSIVFGILCVSSISVWASRAAIARQPNSARTAKSGILAGSPHTVSKD